MNRIAITALILAAGASSAFAADAKDAKPTKTETAEAAFDALPTKAKTAAKNQLNGGTVTAVKKDTMNNKDAWDITFSDKAGKSHEIEVTESGSVVNKDKKDDKKK